MIRKILKAIGLTLAAALVVGVGLYLFGLRVVVDGGGGLHLQFVKSAEARAAELARHREAQRAQTQSAAPSPPAAPAAPVAPAADGSASGAAADVRPAIVMPDLAGLAENAVKAADPARAGWTDFRGPRRNGHYEQPILTDWPAGGPKPLWKQPVGGGYASFVIARGRAFTIEQRGADEVVAAYDVATGRELWTNVWPAHFKEMMGGDGPRATPTWADGRVYALGAQGELRAIDDATGSTAWRTNILQDAGARNLQWGMSAAPLIVDNTVVVLPGGGNGQSVVAYERASGKKAWSALDDQQSYSSPMLVTLGGERQILVFSAARLVGLATDGSRVLWEHPWRTEYDVNASQPIVIGDNRLFVSTGYGKGAAVLELTRNGDGFSVREVWRNIRMKNQFTSSVLYDGFIYGLDESILACVDAATGDLKWKGGRYGYGQVMLASGHLIVLTEDGNLALVQATPERHVEKVRFPVLEGKTWNHPAMADGFLLVRNLAEMAAFDLRIPR